MPRPLHCLLVASLALVLGAGGAGRAQAPAPYQSAAETRAALTRALAEQRVAAARGRRLEAEAGRVTEAVEKTAREAAALAARIQQTEAGLAASEARIALLEGRRAVLRDRLAARQAPLIRLTAALQRLSRRPLALGLMRPGSLRDIVHLRAMLATMLPAIRARTAGLRAEIERGRRLALAARAERRRLSAGQDRLTERRRALAALESRQRLASRAARGTANREQDRAMALAEDARDLGALISELERAGSLRARLAALPGPVLRPQRPAAARVRETATAPAPARPPLRYILPVAGRLVAGFGERGGGGGLRARGLTLAPRPGAQVVAPAAGRVAFAAPYQGYGRIVIIEHAGGWTTLVTDLAALSVAVGDDVVQGAPLGVAAGARPAITVELRKDGEPVDILQAVDGG